VQILLLTNDKFASKNSKLWECEEYETSLHGSGDMLTCMSHLIILRISLSQGVTDFFLVGALHICTEAEKSNIDYI